MIKKQLECQPSAVSRFLAGQMSADEQRHFEQHLDKCHDCRRQLTNATASDSWWHETREFLAGETDLDDSETVSFLNPTDNPHMLGRFGGYEIAGIIGQGGMGVVLKGFDTSLNRFAAIKVLAPQLATRGSARNRFAREAKAAAAVVHDNVIAIHGVSEAAGLPYLVMPYVRGESLQKRIDRDGPMTATEVVRIAHQVASGLAAAHAQGLVHRDIKPANILLPQGIQRVLITDFGLARAVDDSNLTGTGTIAGTPQFMSPEQARGETVDPRSDLFSLGTVMYTMCTGRSPFRADNPFGVLRRIIEDQPRAIREVNPDIPDWLEAIIQKLQAKSTEDRYQNASELANLLEACLAHLQNPSVGLPNGLKSTRMETQRITMTSWIAVGIIAVVVALSGWALSSNFNLEKQTLDSSSRVAQQDQQHEQEKERSRALADKQVENDQKMAGVAAKQQLQAEVVREKQKLQEDADRRERLIVYSNQMMALRQEGNFLGALQLEKEILEILKYSDKDHERMNQLRKSMIQARLEGKHELADDLIKKIKQIEIELEKRYADLDRIREMEVKSRKREELQKRYQELMVEGKHDEALEVEREIEDFTRKLELEWLNSGTGNSKSESTENSVRGGNDPNFGRSDSSPETETKTDPLERLVKLENDVLNATASLQAANAELSHAKTDSQRSQKLVEKGYMSQREFERGELAVKTAESKVATCRNDLTLAEEKLDSQRSQLLDQIHSDQPTTSRIKTIEFLIDVLESQLQVELQKYKREHPRVRSLQKQIDYWRKLAPDTRAESPGK